MLLIALAAIFLINFAIISLYDGVEPRCYHINSWGISYSYTINVWEGLWIPVPSFVTGIIGKKALIFFIILYQLSELSNESPINISD